MQTDIFFVHVTCLARISTNSTYFRAVSYLHRTQISRKKSCSKPVCLHKGHSVNNKSLIQVHHSLKIKQLQGRSHVLPRAFCGSLNSGKDLNSDDDQQRVKLSTLPLAPREKATHQMPSIHKSVSVATSCTWGSFYVKFRHFKMAVGYADPPSTRALA